MRRRTGLFWGAILALALALASHLGYWYWPRERDGRPSLEAEELLRAPGWAVAVWIGYPHQNLGAFERRVGEVRGWLELLRGSEESGGRALPRFGPFAVPPATELVVAERPGGGGLRALVRVYPAVGMVARAAGRLARNPWLAGGDVRLGKDRRGWVEWRDGVWTLDAGEPDAESARARERPLVLPERQARALVRLGRPLGRLPAATYRLIRAESGLELRSGPGLAESPEPLRGGSPSPMAWLVEAEGRGDAAGLLLWDEAGALPPFPSAATLRRGRREMRLPGEELLRLAGREAVRERAAGFEVRALGRTEATLAGASARELEALFVRRPDLRLVAGADLDRLREAAARIADRFRGLPIARLAGIDSERIARVLAAAEGCGTSRLELRSRPARLRWLVCPGIETAAGRGSGPPPV